MTRGRARRYLLTQQGYYPGVVASLGYTVFDWSTLNAGTLFQDSAKTTPASANGDVIGCWTDGVGGVDATQVTTPNKPGLDTASLNGLPTLSFDGSDILATGNISISTFAVWLVFKASNFATLYEQSTNSASLDGMYLTSSIFTANIKRGANRTTKDIAINWSADATWRIVRHTSNGTNATHNTAINNVDQSMSSTAFTGDVGTATATNPLYIGSKFGFTTPLTGNIGQLLIMSPYPTADILANMESYINGIWGVY